MRARAGLGRRCPRYPALDARKAGQQHEQPTNGNRAPGQSDARRIQEGDDKSASEEHRPDPEQVPSDNRRNQPKDVALRVWNRFNIGSRDAFVEAEFYRDGPRKNPPPALVPWRVALDVDWLIPETSQPLLA